MRADVAVIGAGIAGAAAAYELSRTHDVVVLERESQPGYHTTGRSVALFTEAYGNDAIRALTRASRSFLEAPPAGFADQPLLRRRGVLMIAPLGAEALVAAESAAGPVRILSVAEAMAMVPVLRREYVAHALFEPEASDIDVAGLHGGYLRAARARGARIVTDAELHRGEFRQGRWHLDTGAGPIVVGALVNAAGAWADEIALRAGVAALGLVPKRRTVIVFDAPAGHDTREWPMVLELGERFYVKPESGRLLASPADETPSPPCDAQAEEIDIAVAVDRIETATHLKVSRITRRWAGLRSFFPDKSLAIGDAIDQPGFFWLAGQGGYGIQTAPAAARILAAQFRDEDPSEVAPDLARESILPARLAARSGSGSAVSR